VTAINNYSMRFFNICSPSVSGTVLVLWAVVLLAATLIGITLALGIYSITIVILTMMAGLTLIAFPVVGVWVVIVGALVAAGLIDLYMPAFRPLLWAVALLSMVIAAIALINAFFGQTGVQAAAKEGNGLAIWLFLFVFFAIFASLANWHGFGGFVVGLKGYFQVWGLLIAIYYLTKDADDARRLISFFVLLGILQLPFVLHQILVLVPMRSSEIYAEQSIVAGDIVAGTFGGSMLGGGRSSNLALLCVISVVIVLAQWRAGLRTTWSAALVTLLLMLPMFLSEAKLFLILFPIALFLLFSDCILRKPLKVIVGVAGLATLLMGISFTYSLLPSARSQHASSLQEMWRSNIEYNLGKRGYGSALLNRSTIYPFWIKEHSHGDMLIAALIGHGPGATSGGTFPRHSREPSGGSQLNEDSLAYQRYRHYGIDLTGLSSLLWEVGLLGTVSVFAMFISAYRLGGRLVDQWRGTLHWPVLKTAQIAIPLFVVSLLHNNYFVFDLSFQTMLIIILGYLLAMTRLGKKYD
jgi:hypothetical protein